MRYLTRVYLIFGVLLLKSVASLAVVFFALSHIEHHVRRTTLAHAVYEDYLALSVKAARIFKKLEDQLLIETPRTSAADVDALAAEVADHTARIRAAIGAEIQLVGEEEIEELALLARIETAIAETKAGLERLDRWREQGDPRFESDLSPTLEGGSYLEFRVAVAEALEGEAAEVRESEASTARHIAFMRTLAAAAFGVGLIVAWIGVRMLRQDLRGPVTRLQDGAKALGAGDLNHRIAETGPNELCEVAAAFNAMADRIAVREHELETSRSALEAAVSARTAELERALHQLGDADSRRRRLLSDVSHELRTPLTIIQGEAEFALRGREKPTADYREALGRARDAAIHCGRIVEDLLFVARAEEGVARLNLGDVDLAALLAEMADVGRGLLTDAHGAVRVEASPATAMVRADAQRLRQVLLILIENALRYGGGDATLRLDPAPGGYTLSVADQGPGMTEAELAGAFDRFYRGPGAALRYAGGSGLGLPVARSIVEAHGGRIALRSETGAGVTATVVLPARPKLEAVS